MSSVVDTRLTGRARRVAEPKRKRRSASESRTRAPFAGGIGPDAIDKYDHLPIEQTANWWRAQGAEIRRSVPPASGATIPRAAAPIRPNSAPWAAASAPSGANTATPNAMEAGSATSIEASPPQRSPTMVSRRSSGGTSCLALRPV